MSIHEGHRERLKNRYRREGLDNFDELYVLELLLFYCIPRKDTNPIAHRLLDHFGSITAVLDASPEALEKVEGVSKATATFLSLITDAGRYYQTKQKEMRDTPLRLDQCGDYLAPRFFGYDVEVVYLLCLDAKGDVLCCKKIGEGSINSASIPVRRVIEVALSVNATTVVLGHNHPSGLAIPSADDIQTTYRIAAALDAVDVVLADHIVVSQDDYVSMAQSQYYNPFDLCAAR